jgi:hypothetical protein
VDEAVPVSERPAPDPQGAAPGAGNGGRADAHADPAPTSAWPEPIVVPTWRWRVWLAPGTWLVTLGTFFVIVCIAGVAGVSMFFALDAIERLALQGAASFAANAAAVVAVVALAALAMRDVFRRASRGTALSFAGHIPASEPARAFMLAELAEGGPPKDTWGAWHVRRWLDRAREGRHVRAYVSEHLAARTERYDRTDRPLEPEAIGGGMGRGDVAQIVACSAAGAGYWWVSGRGLNPITFACAVAIVAAISRMVRRRSLFAPVVAGTGWVQHGAVRWTVEDSVLVAMGWANARTCIVGPKGVLVLRLRTSRHRDFEALWVRWMHPVPRLDQPAFDA